MDVVVALPVSCETEDENDCCSVWVVLHRHECSGRPIHCVHSVIIIPAKPVAFMVETKFEPIRFVADPTGDLVDFCKTTRLIKKEVRLNLFCFLLFCFYVQRRKLCMKN